MCSSDLIPSKERSALHGFEWLRVIAHVVARQERQQHHIRVELPDVMPQREQFLSAPPTRNSKAEDFVMRIVRSSLLIQLSFEHSGERRIVGDLQGFDVRVAEHGNTNGPSRLLDLMLAITKAKSVHLKRRVTFLRPHSSDRKSTRLNSSH